MVSIGRMSTPLPSPALRSTRKVRESFGALGRLIRRRGARRQQHQVGLRRAAAGPDLVAVDHVAVAVAHGAGLELRGVVGADDQLGHAERLQSQLARRDLRRVRALPAARCRGAAAFPLCTSGRDTPRRAAARVDGLEDHRRGAQRQPRAAVFLRDERAQYSCSVSTSTNASGSPWRRRASPSLAGKRWQMRRTDRGIRPVFAELSGQAGGSGHSRLPFGGSRLLVAEQVLGRRENGQGPAGGGACLT